MLGGVEVAADPESVRSYFISYDILTWTSMV